MQRFEIMALEYLRGKSAKTIYWENENIVFNEQSLSEACKYSVDTVVTHTCPSFCSPVDKISIEYWLKGDVDLHKDLNTELSKATKIFDYLTSHNCSVKQWFYGHFHTSHIEYIDDVKFQLLNIHEIVMI